MLAPVPNQAPFGGAGVGARRSDHAVDAHRTPTRNRHRRTGPRSAPVAVSFPVSVTLLATIPIG